MQWRRESEIVALYHVFVTSKVAVTFGSVSVSVLAQVPSHESVPVSEYVAAEACEVFETKRKDPTTATRVSRVTRIFMMFISPTGCIAVSRARQTTSKSLEMCETTRLGKIFLHLEIIVVLRSSTSSLINFEIIQ
jgi:hypothetical protein